LAIYTLAIIRSDFGEKLLVTGSSAEQTPPDTKTAHKNTTIKSGRFFTYKTPAVDIIFTSAAPANTNAACERIPSIKNIQYKWRMCFFYTNYFYPAPHRCQIIALLPTKKCGLAKRHKKALLTQLYLKATILVYLIAGYF
jgi:hypothetical protein